MPDWIAPLILPYALAVGAVVGSFLNVVIHRVPRDLSVVRPRSACPSCGALIRWYDNLPVLSWVLLRARCRQCAAAISVRYPLVELAAAAVGALAVHRYGVTVTGAEVAIFAWVSIALGLIDLEHQLLPDVMTVPAIALGLGASYLGGFAPLLDSVVGAAVGALLPITVIFLYKLLRGEEGMGWGDVKYLAAIGAVVGVRDCLWVLVLAAVAGALFGGAVMALGRGSMKTALPFGSFLAAAVLVWLFLPEAWRVFLTGSQWLAAVQ
jgi:leader peptidase (prepilin peptidase)/N-methyltransferase